MGQLKSRGRSNCGNDLLDWGTVIQAIQVQDKDGRMRNKKTTVAIKENEDRTKIQINNKGNEVMGRKAQRRRGREIKRKRESKRKQDHSDKTSPEQCG